MVGREGGYEISSQDAKHHIYSHPRWSFDDLSALLFEIFAPKVSNGTRINLIAQYLHLQEIFLTAGLYSQHKVDATLALRGTLKACLMCFESLSSKTGNNDDNDNDNNEYYQDDNIGYYQAQPIMFPPGYFKPTCLKNICCLANVLKICSTNCTYLRWKLDANKFHKLLVAHGAKGNSNPTNEDYVCCGFNGPCKSLNSNNPNKKLPQFVGAKIAPGCTMYGHFICKACCRRVEKHNHDTLSAI